MLALILFFLVFFNNLLSSFLWNSVFLVVFLALSVFWFLSIFVYLYNSSSYSSHTRVLTSFWRSCLSIFWSLEIFLFSIYVYLFFLCPIETEWLAEHNQLFYNSDILPTSYLTQLLALCVFLVLVRGHLASIGSNNFQFILFYLVILVYFIFLLLEEFCVLFLYNSLLSDVALSFNKLDGFWELSGGSNPNLVLYQYMYILILLKYWHSLFIYGFFYLDLYWSVADSSYSASSLSFSQTNLTYLFFFNLTPILFFINLNSQSTLGLTYFSFFTHTLYYSNFASNLLL